jgi:hypothetical protein
MGSPCSLLPSTLASGRGVLSRGNPVLVVVALRLWTNLLPHNFNPRPHFSCAYPPPHGHGILALIEVCDHTITLTSPTCDPFVIPVHDLSPPGKLAYLYLSSGMIVSLPKYSQFHFVLGEPRSW